MLEMSDKLTAELRAFVPAAGAMGSSGGVDRKALQSRMEAILQDSRRLFFVAAGMTATVFVILVVLTIIYREHWQVVTGLSGAMGLTVAASIERMTRLARDMAYTNLIVQLSSTLSGEHMFKVVQALIAKK